MTNYELATMRAHQWAVCMGHTSASAITTCITVLALAQTLSVARYV